MYHTYITLLVPSLLAFAITIVATRFIISYMLESGITGMDHNKGKRAITLPSSGGIAVAVGFTVGVLAYAFGGSFNLYVPVASLRYLFATVIAVLLVTIVGFLDDLNVSRKLVKTTDMMDTHRGLKQWQKPVLTLMGALPLMAINAGVSIVRLPFVGNVNFGIFYPLIIIPLAVIFTANAFNLLGGFDGIATGSGTLAALAMLVYSLIFGTYIGTLVSAILFATLVGFLVFNLYPAKIIPGDSYTYFVGVALVTDMILGNMESFGVIIFMPWIIEFFLHLRRKFKVKDLGIMQKDGTFKPPYGKKIYSITHIAMNVLKKPYEWKVSMFAWAIEAGFIAIAFALKLLSLL